MSRIITAILKIFFYLLYHPFAWLYDLVAEVVSLGRWKHWIYSTLPYIQGQRILEIGHGPGHLQAALSARGLYPVGLDSSPQMGRLAFNRMKNSQSSPLLINGYAQNIPFSRRSFSTVAATFPTEYIFQSDTLHEIYRVLKPDGVLLVLPAAIIESDLLLDRLFAWLFRITRQAPPRIDSAFIAQVCAPFERSGFTVDPQVISVKRSRVLLLICSPVEQILDANQP